jgi:hypothetical protein
MHLIDKLRNICDRAYIYALGARRIGVTTLTAMGCLPAAMTLYGLGANECVERLNNDAVSFNKKLNATSKRL